MRSVSPFYAAFRDGPVTPVPFPPSWFQDAFGAAASASSGSLGRKRPVQSQENCHAGPWVVTSEAHKWDYCNSPKHFYWRIKEMTNTREQKQQQSTE